MCERPLNHIELDELVAGNLTQPTEQVARSLGIVAQVPCVVVLDAIELASSGHSTVVSFPRDREELSTFVRRLVAEVASYGGEFVVHAGILETVRGLFDRQAELKRQRGAPAVRKLQMLQSIFAIVAKDPQAGMRALARARRVLGEEVTARAKEVASMGQTAERERSLADMIRKVAEDDERLALEIVSCKEQIRQQRELLEELPSLSKAITRAAMSTRQSITRAAVTAVAADVLKSTLTDVVKPSFWLKLLGF